ncbi:hypothetical protein BFG04_03880 [Campylobacter pinnipediorum subsp. pinnipediorum]|uniref:Phage holin n=1 Tax=Campylobacter pinnipediorum subsp. pinnipediorum TaxID=1660067 RepID=A0AAX0L9T7_9BACT|nr:hypothetical protein [Campylobacter pinnipediorum]OPA77243.1 hypothetical protein BFG04_03880 [Campylobacter pinnipediorum subsp. pinnipediorum]
MNDILIFFEKNSYLLWIAIIGLVAGFLNDKYSEDKTNTRKIANFFTGAISSMFFCWIAYEISYYFTDHERLSLAVGGFVAWRGAEWINSIVDKFIETKTNKGSE